MMVILAVVLCRALELAVKHKTHVDTVLGYRELYLSQLDSQENLNDFQQYAGKVCIRKCMYMSYLNKY